MDQSTSPPSFDTEEYYEVERIVDHGCNEVGMWFRVRWKGYGPDSDTWEPENNFMKPSFVRKYLKKVAKEAAARQKSGKARQSPEKDETTTTVSAVNEALGQGKVKSDSNNNDSVDQHSQDLAPYPAYNRYKHDFQKSDWKVAEILNDRLTYLGTKELLVRWQNIGDASICFHSWELQSGLDSCGAIVKFYAEG